MANGHYLVAFFEAGDDLDLIVLDKAQLDGDSAHCAILDEEDVVLVGFEDQGLLGDDQGLGPPLGNNAHCGEHPRFE